MKKPLSLLHDIPVNKMAASMFWKTPEWAMAPEEVKKGIIEARLPEEKLNIDFIKKPKQLGSQKPIDRRGYVFYKPIYDDDQIEKFVKCLIIGHECVVRRVKKDNYPNPRYKGKKPNKKRLFSEHRWWCLDENSEIFSIKWSDVKRYVNKYEHK